MVVCRSTSLDVDEAVQQQDSSLDEQELVATPATALRKAQICNSLCRM